MNVNKWFAFWIKNLPIFIIQSHHKLGPTSVDAFSISVTVNSPFVKDNKSIPVYMAGVWNYFRFWHSPKRIPEPAWSAKEFWFGSIPLTPRPKGDLFAAVMSKIWKLSKRGGCLWIPTKPQVECSSRKHENCLCHCVTMSSSYWFCLGHIRPMVQVTSATRGDAHCQKSSESHGMQWSRRWVGGHCVVLLGLVSGCVSWNSGTFNVLAVHLLNIVPIRELGYFE